MVYQILLKSSFIGSVFDPDTQGHAQKLKEMDPINFETDCVYRTRVPTEMRDGATRADELRRRLTEADEGSTEAGGAPTKTDEADEGSTRQTEADEGWRRMKELRRRLEEADEGWRSFDAETMVTEEGQRRLRKMKQREVLSSYDVNSKTIGIATGNVMKNQEK